MAVDYLRYSQKSKSHVIAGVLALVLGTFGVHKFYLGYNQAGFVMLAVSIIGSILTLGLAAAVVQVIAMVEGVIYLIKSQAAFDEAYVRHVREWF